MELPQTLEGHLYQIAKQLVCKTTAGLQELFRYHWKAIRGHAFWDVETGSDLWHSCHTQLKSTSKQKIVKGQISRWTIADLSVLLPELMRKNGKDSLAKTFSEGLKNIQDLFTPFEIANPFVVLTMTLSKKEFKRFKLSLTSLLTQLDTEIMKLSNFTKDLISDEDFAEAFAILENIRQQPIYSLSDPCPCKNTSVVRLVTHLLEKFSNLPTCFEGPIRKFWYHAKLGTDVMEDSLKLLAFDRLSSNAHAKLARYWHVGNPWLNYYHGRKEITLKTHRSRLYRFMQIAAAKEPNTFACVELRKAIQFTQNEDDFLESGVLAMRHFQRAFQLGNPLGLYAYAHCLIVIILTDFEEEQRQLKNRCEANLNDVQNAVQMLAQEVVKSHQFFNYNSCPSEYEKVGNSHFILGYLCERRQVYRDLDKAKTLYQTATTVYNNELASYYLGSMYYDGAGVRKSYMWAKLYWEHSNGVLKEEWTVFALLDYYLKHLEFQHAKAQVTSLAYVAPRVRHKHLHILILDLIVKFEGLHAMVKLEALKAEIVASEQTWNLSGKGLTFLERLKRVELLGFEHEYGDAIMETYAFFKLSYEPKRTTGGERGMMSEYIHGVDNCLEVDYSQLFSRLYLAAPARVFTVTTFRHNLAANTHPRWNIKYNTRSEDELLDKLPKTFKDGFHQQYTVVEDLLFTKDGIYLILEDATGIIHQLKVGMKMKVLRMERHLKLEYGAKIVLSCSDGRSLVGNADPYFNDTLGPMYVIVTGKVVDMCRFCYDSIVRIKKCSCGACYCGQTCFDKDWMFLKHRFVCSV